MVDYGWGPVTSTPTAAQYAPNRQKTDPAASMALVFALVGGFTWGLSCIVALFLAPRAKRNVAVSPDTRKGKGLALAAQIISGWSLVIIAVVTLAVFAR